MTGKEILNLTMEENDAGAKTIRDYIKALVERVWDETESFSGKRPFGNSGWYCDLFNALEAHGVIKEDDRKQGDKLIREAIKAL